MSSGSSLDARLTRFRTRGGESAAELARDLLAAGRGAEAASVAARGLEASPNDAQLLVLAGRARLAEGDPIGAEAMLLRAVRAAPADATALYWLGKVLLARGDSVRAVKVLERGVALHPNDDAMAALLERARKPEGTRSAPDEPAETPSRPSRMEGAPAATSATSSDEPAASNSPPAVPASLRRTVAFDQMPTVRLEQKVEAVGEPKKLKRPSTFDAIRIKPAGASSSEPRPFKTPPAPPHLPALLGALRTTPSGAVPPPEPDFAVPPAGSSEKEREASPPVGGGPRAESESSPQPSPSMEVLSPPPPKVPPVDVISPELSAEAIDAELDALMPEAEPTAADAQPASASDVESLSPELSAEVVDSEFDSLLVEVEPSADEVRSAFEAESVSPELFSESVAAAFDSSVDGLAETLAGEKPKNTGNSTREVGWSFVEQDQETAPSKTPALEDSLLAIEEIENASSPDEAASNGKGPTETFERLEVQTEPSELPSPEPIASSPSAASCSVPVVIPPSIPPESTSLDVETVSSEPEFPAVSDAALEMGAQEPLPELGNDDAAVVAVATPASPSDLPAESDVPWAGMLGVGEAVPFGSSAEESSTALVGAAPSERPGEEAPTVASVSRRGPWVVLACVTAVLLGVAAFAFHRGGGELFSEPSAELGSHAAAAPREAVVSDSSRQQRESSTAETIELGSAEEPQVLDGEEPTPTEEPAALDGEVERATVEERGDAEGSSRVAEPELSAAQELEPNDAAGGEHSPAEGPRVERRDDVVRPPAEEPRGGREADPEPASVSREPRTSGAPPRRRSSFERSPARRPAWQPSARPSTEADSSEEESIESESSESRSESIAEADLPDSRRSEEESGRSEEDRLRDALARDPNDHSARVSLALLLAARGQSHEVEELLAEFGAEPAGRLRRAEALVRLGRREEARAILDGLGESARTKPEARMIAARIALAEGRASEAVEALQEFAAAPGASAALLALYARALLASGRVAAASEAYSASMERDADLPEAILGRAEMAVRSRRPADAMRLLRRVDVGTLRPELVTRHLLLRGRAELMLGQRAAARRTLERVVERPGAPTQAWFFLGEARAGHDYRAARDAYERYLELEPEGYYATRARRAIGR